MEAALLLMLFATELYLIAGFLFSLAFIFWGLASFDPDAKGTGPIFRILIFPGLVVLWPIIFVKWIKKGRDE